jgi:hypothetical protein
MKDTNRRSTKGACSVTTKPRKRGEAGRIGSIRAGLILGSLVASLVGTKMLVSQEAPTPAPPAVAESRSTIQAAPQAMPIPARQAPVAPVTRSRSS